MFLNVEDTPIMSLCKARKYLTITGVTLMAVEVGVRGAAVFMPVVLNRIKTCFESTFDTLRSEETKRCSLPAFE